jgi:mRNA-degrading endonuclease RelE of RelBE toxin-antitoxin system
MIVLWSKSAEKQLSAIDSRYQKRIREKLRTMDDKNAPAPDIKKLARYDDHYRLRIGDYRIIFTRIEDTADGCYIVAITRRTSTTYLHEEAKPYGCASD